MNKKNEMVFVEGFRQRMGDHGLDPGQIDPDGVIHRFPTWGDSAGECSGSYWHNGNVGWFQDWRTMEKPEIVHGELSEADREALNGSFTGANNKVSREALEAGIRRIWSAGIEPGGHPYLKSKGINALPEVKQNDGCLVIPVFGINGELNGLQRIDAEGHKRFLSGTRKKGSFFGISGNGTYIVCEGFATGVSLHEATGASIAIAFDAGNLANVAKEISKKVSPQNIIIAGDNDIANEKNIGAEMAGKASMEIGCRVMLPEFQSPDGKKTTDFNDLHRVEGLDAVKSQFEAALAQTEPKSNLINEVLSIIDLDPLTREQERNRIAKEYKARVSIIDQYIKEFKKQEEVGGIPEIVTEIEPFGEAVDGAILLNAIAEEVTNHVILREGAPAAIATWVLLTYCSDAFRILPILGLTSPVKRCGKTTLLEVLQGLVNKGLTASNISPAAVFRTIDKYHPTLLIDEADTFLKDNEELRGVLNSGHTRTGAFVVRIVGEEHEPKKFSTWGAKAISMIGNLPETLQDRSVIIELRRKMPGETAAKLNIDFESECLGIRRKCQRWADDNLDKLTITRPEMPKTNNDRMADNWMPLFAIAQVAGGEWPGLIKKSMLNMMGVEEDNIGSMLLSDIQEIFQSNEVVRIFSDDLIEGLKNMADRPWVDWSRGKGLTQNGLARLLKPFGVKSKNMRINENLRKGYELDGFKDAFKRYICILPTEHPISSVTTSQVNNINVLDADHSVTDKNDVTDKKQDNQLNLKDCYTVTDENGETEEDIKEETPLWQQLRFDSEQDYLKMIS